MWRDVSAAALPPPPPPAPVREEAGRMNTSNNHICCAVARARRSSGRRRRHAFFKRLSSSHPKSSREPEVHSVLQPRRCRSLIGSSGLERHRGDTVCDTSPHTHTLTHTSTSLRLLWCSSAAVAFVTVPHSWKIPPNQRFSCPFPKERL